jgi:hypothetical protein
VVIGYPEPAHDGRDLVVADIEFVLVDFDFFAHPLVLKLVLKLLDATDTVADARHRLTPRSPRRSCAAVVPAPVSGD